MSRFPPTPRAQRDLTGIEEWIKRNNLRRAASYVVDLIERICRLAEQPLIGRSRRETERDHRSMPHGNFVIHCRPVTGGIEVPRVVHSKRAWVAACNRPPQRPGKVLQRSEAGAFTPSARVLPSSAPSTVTS